MFATAMDCANRRMDDMTLMPAMIIGVAQAIAIIPGHQPLGHHHDGGARSGFERPEAARFSFLLGIPAIAGAGVLMLGEALARASRSPDRCAVTAVLTFLVALATIAFLMRMVRH